MRDKKPTCRHAIGISNGKNEFYDAKVSSLNGSYEMKVRLIKVEKGEFLSMDNPGYDKFIERYQHLEPVKTTRQRSVNNQYISYSRRWRIGTNQNKYKTSRW